MPDLTLVPELAQGGYKCVLVFPDQSENFVYGFEAGGIYERLKSSDTVGTLDAPLTVREENLEVYRRMAVSSHFEFTSWYSGTEGWFYATFTKLPTRPKLVT